MSQPSDPLLAFNAEPGVAESSVTPVDSPAVDASLPADGLQARIDQFERSLNRALTEIAALKSDQATLVSALDDLKKRQSRPSTPVPTPAAAPTVRPRPRARAIVAALVVAALIGTAGWLASAEWGVQSAELPVQSAESGVRSPESGVQSAAPAAEPGSVVEPPPIVLAAAEIPAPAPERPLSTPDSALRTPYVGTLSIDASPGGRVFINRQSIGETPARAEKLRAGSHLVWIERDGYRRWTRVVTVSANRVSRVFADLEPLDRR